MLQGLYAILDEGVMAGQDLVRAAEDYLQGGIKILQYRHKKRNDSPQVRKDYLNTAQAIASLKSKYSFTYIINDDLEAFQQTRADGMHIGKDDLSLEKCRQSIGSKIIGYSSHSLLEAIGAEKRGANYVAFGAIYPTTTKGPGHPVQGLQSLREVVGALNVPVVAIGGIGRDNVQDVLETGVAMVAMISALARPEPEDRILEARHFVGIMNK